MELLNVGYGNQAAAARIVAIVSPEAAPSRRMVQDAKDNGRCIDATGGRRTRAVLVLDTGHILLSALQTETLAARLTRGEEPAPLTIRRPGREENPDERDK